MTRSSLKLLSLAILSPFVSAANGAAPPRCDMTSAFRQADEEGKTTTAVWQDASGTSILFADAMKVNTDGTKRSYSVDDFWGAETALNNLCNASSDKCQSLKTEPQKRARRLLVQDAKAKSWPVELMKATRLDPGIIPLKDGKPCPEVDGFLVSATALHRATISDVCDLTSYVDALAVNAIVIPRGPLVNGVRQPSQFATRQVKVGDLAAVMSANGSIMTYAVVGDTGPANELGEVSLALAGKLLGKSSPPVNYKEVKSGWAPGKTFILVFSGTRDATDPYMTQARIDTSASAAFAKWGGIDRMKACAVSYIQR
jgi:hypothetical protein